MGLGKFLSGILVLPEREDSLSEENLRFGEQLVENTLSGFDARC